MAEAAKAMLGDTLGLNYVGERRVKGAITIQTTKAIPKEALLEMFEIVLGGEGAAIVVDKASIASCRRARRMRPRRCGAGANSRRLPASARRSIPLQYVAAAEMERIVKAVAPNANLLRADAARNLLLVAGTRGEHDAIADAVSVFDVDWMKGMSFGLFPIETGDPEAIAQELDTVFANDHDSPSKGIVRFVPNRRLKSVLVITSRPEYLRKAETWLVRIDMATRATVKQVFVYQIRNRPAVELAQLLQKIYGGSRTGPSVRPPTCAHDRDGAAARLPGAVAQGPLSSFHRAASGWWRLRRPPPLRRSPPKRPALSLRPQRPVRPGGPPDDRFSGVAIVADETNNALVITATAQEYRRVRQILEQIDVSPNQVLLEATIAEVRLTDELKMGVRWFLQTGNHQFKFTDTRRRRRAGVPGLLAVLQHAQRSGGAECAEHHHGHQHHIVADTDGARQQEGDAAGRQRGADRHAIGGGVLTPGSPIVNSITYRNTGIMLNITPRIGDRGRILLEIEQEASDVVSTKTSKIDSPTIQQRRIKTTVAVNDGEGIVLGGLIQDRANNTRDQVPLVGQIPLVGNLFKSKTDRSPGPSCWWPSRRASSRIPRN